MDAKVAAFKAHFCLLLPTANLCNVFTAFYLTKQLSPIEIIEEVIKQVLKKTSPLKVPRSNGVFFSDLEASESPLIFFLQPHFHNY